MLQFMITFQIRAFLLLLSLVVSSLAAPEAPEVQQSAGGGGVFDFVNSWFDKISSWFGSFGFGSGFSSTVNIDVVDINNKSARFVNQNL